MAQTREDDLLEQSRERHIPGQGGTPTALEHEHRYDLAGPILQGLDVLDVGCGEGYGTALMAGSARTVVGIDIDEAAALHARATYGRPGLSFEVGDALALPFEPRTFDACVLYEVIEHVEDAPAVLRELRRVLRPGGLLLVSTPDPEVAHDAHPAVNPFHRRLFKQDELIDVVSKDFRVAQVLGQIVTAASFAWPVDQPVAADREFACAVPWSLGPKYFVLLATAGDAPSGSRLAASLRPDLDLGVIRERDAFWADSQWASSEIERLSATPDDAALRGELDGATGELERLRRSLAQLRRAEVEAQTRLAQALAELDKLRSDAAVQKTAAESATTELALARKALATTETQARTAEGLLADQSKAMSRAVERSEHLQELLRSVLESRSWRLTRPLRLLRGSTRPETAGFEELDEISR